MMFPGIHLKKTCKIMSNSILCLKICSGGFANKVYNYEHMGPYGWRDDIWIGYEDYQSLACKVNL